MEGIFRFIEKYYCIIILLFVCIALIYPSSFTWVLSNYANIDILNLLLSIVLFTMGTTLKVDDFISIFKNPKEIVLGISAQYIIMPILAFALASLFSLDMALMVGVILVGTVPGGTASDLMAFLANEDVALSVSLTAVSTLLSPILTPILTLILVGNQISFSPIDMFLSILQIVIIPILIGLMLNYKFPAFCTRLKEYLPAISAIVVCVIVAGVISVNKQAILTSSFTIMMVIIIQYFLAMASGFIIGYLSGMNRKTIITIAIELSFQNSGLSTGLAKTHFPNLVSATVPGALYSIWQNFAGSIMTYVLNRYYNSE